MSNTEAKPDQANAPTLQPPVKLLSKRAAADLIGICPHTLARWIRMGKIKPLRFNSRTLRFDPADIIRLVDQARG